MQASDLSAQEKYKSHFFNSVNEFKKTTPGQIWESENGLQKGGTNEVLQSHGVDIYQNAGKFQAFGSGKEGGGSTGLLTKVTSCHDIWLSDQYTTPEWRPEICQSVYTVDFKNKYTPLTQTR